MEVELKSYWKDFKIVETRSGVFSGQITSDHPLDFNEADRIRLALYTKIHLEKLLGYEIIQLEQKK